MHLKLNVVKTRIELTHTTSSCIGYKCDLLRCPYHTGCKLLDENVSES